MEKNIIITILPSLFLKIYDEISDNPDKYKMLRKFKAFIIFLTLFSTFIYSLQGSGYCFLLFMHGLFCSLQKQLDDKIYLLGMIILFMGMIINDKSQLKNLIFQPKGIYYLLFTFIFVIFEEQLFPEEVSKSKVITRILFVISGCSIYYFLIRKIENKDIRTMLTANLFASVFYYLTSVIMKLSDKNNNPLKSREPYIEDMIKRIINVFLIWEKK